MRTIQSSYNGTDWNIVDSESLANHFRKPIATEVLIDENDKILGPAPNAPVTNRLLLSGMKLDDAIANFRNANAYRQFDQRRIDQRGLQRRLQRNGNTNAAYDAASHAAKHGEAWQLPTLVEYHAQPLRRAA